MLEDIEVDDPPPQLNSDAATSTIQATSVKPASLRMKFLDYG